MDDYKQVVHQIFSSNKQVELLFVIYFTEKYTDCFLEFEYRLFIEKNEISHTKTIIRFIQDYVHDVILERETSSELVFGIKRSAAQHIGRLVSALDEQQQSIAINGYGLSMTTIEEVFLRLVEEEENKIDDYNRCTEETRRTLARNRKFISTLLLSIHL